MSQSFCTSTTAASPSTSSTTQTSPANWDDDRAALHHLPKAARRLLLATPARKMCDAVLERALQDGVRKRRVPLAAVEGTGLESRHTSRYSVKRRSSTGDRDQITTYAKFPKVVFVVDCTSHMILAAVPGRGPGSDLVQFQSALGQAVGRARIGTLLADADFDAEWVHCGIRSHGIRTMTRRRAGDRRTSHRRAAGGGG